ncbi:uncharacterized protein LOC105426077 isoform X2 [Pogonomyrmex barbatus]|uniref:Uncharacterized protein LOC105426077 isoform X2 n=1 Tax=Pogonomyrmex barbatus TaxID=144034 RepID=A0A6I9W1E7_9HYME|nr:uncharacterized protein LOC105426077 isoform X2 [Pogonomyrmex barbatus]
MSSFTLVTLHPLSSFGANTMIEATSASPSTATTKTATTASSRLFVTEKGKSPGSKDRPSGYRESQCGESQEISVDEFPARFVAFPVGKWGSRKRIFATAVFTRQFGQIQFNT